MATWRCSCAVGFAGAACAEAAKALRPQATSASRVKAGLVVAGEAQASFAGCPYLAARQTPPTLAVRTPCVHAPCAVNSDSCVCLNYQVSPILALPLRYFLK